MKGQPLESESRQIRHTSISGVEIDIDFETGKIFKVLRVVLEIVVIDFSTIEFSTDSFIFMELGFCGFQF
jgi:hypothetical protein